MLMTRNSSCAVIVNYVSLPSYSINLTVKNDVGGGAMILLSSTGIKLGAT